MEGSEWQDGRVLRWLNDKGALRMTSRREGGALAPITTPAAEGSGQSIPVEESRVPRMEEEGLLTIGPGSRPGEFVVEITDKGRRALAK